MKIVVDKHTVAHLFANQSQETARTPGSGSLFFEGDTIYSYGHHFRIAKHVTNAMGERAVLFTERRYSNSTAKHISVVRNAMYRNIISVSTLDSGRYDATPEVIFNAWRNEGETIADKLAKAKKPEIYLNQLAGLKTRVTHYAEFFDLDIPSDLQFLLDIESKSEYSGYAEQKAIAIKEAEALKAKQLQKVTDSQIIKFRNFEVASVHTRGYGVDYLRYNEASDRVETSQYVKIPAEIAKRFYTLVLDTIKAGGCIECGQKLLDYEVKEINKKFIVVGCHKIEIKEIKALTKKLGW